MRRRWDHKDDIVRLTGSNKPGSVVVKFDNKNKQWVRHVDRLGLRRGASYACCMVLSEYPGQQPWGTRRMLPHKPASPSYLTNVLLLIQTHADLPGPNSTNITYTRPQPEVFCVDPWFQAMSIVWNLGKTQEILADVLSAYLAAWPSIFGKTSLIPHFIIFKTCISEISPSLGEKTMKNLSSELNQLIWCRTTSSDGCWWNYPW